MARLTVQTTTSNIPTNGGDLLDNQKRATISQYIGQCNQKPIAVSNGFSLSCPTKTITLRLQTVKYRSSSSTFSHVFSKYI
jgi:hypothetical protein